MSIIHTTVYQITHRYMIEITRKIPNSRPLLILLVSSLVLVLIAVYVFPALLMQGTYAKKAKEDQRHGSQSPTLSPASSPSSCVTYDSTARLITISCQSVSLHDISNQLNNSEVIDKLP